MINAIDNYDYNTLTQLIFGPWFLCITETIRALSGKTTLRMQKWAPYFDYFSKNIQEDTTQIFWTLRVSSELDHMMTDINEVGFRDPAQNSQISLWPALTTLCHQTSLRATREKPGTQLATEMNETSKAPGHTTHWTRSGREEMWVFCSLS